ncbi:unnamed protein product [Clonostachys rosea]|uniref:Zn(2)-C6 fungal-type domain-containing protein n=1 Tax=Bionectria ochroleuca TaxID=29856 RepID=A0ABY6V2S1_BIOOC|nr:unnamed protein product [Clonostachys rosea]
MSETPTHSVPKPPRRYAPRTRLGCLTCRRRKKKCPADGPECRTCVRLSLDCEWDSRRRFPTSGPSPASTAAGEDGRPSSEPDHDLSLRIAELSTAIPPSPSVLPAMTDAADQNMLLSYYIHSFVPNISVVHTSSNFFTSAILACSAAHLAKGAPDSEDQARLLEQSLRSQIRCHRFLQERINLTGRLQTDHIEAIAIILLLVGLEVQNGANTGKWVSQLDCVRNVIKQSRGNGVFCRRSWEAEALYEHFLYHDVMSLIMSGVAGSETDELEATSPSEIAASSPLPFTEAEVPWARFLPRDRPRSNSASLPSTMRKLKASSSIHPLLGLSKDLFFLIQKIPRVKPVQNTGEGLLNPAENELFLNLERQVVDLRFDIASDACVEIDIAARLDLVVLAETYRLAALILLYRRSCVHEDQIPLLAQRIISFAERISEGNAAEAGLTYPMFLAGAELVDEESIVICATKLMKIRERVKVMNIQSAEEVLQEVWRDRLNGGPYRDWENILRSWKWVINLG